MPFPSPNSNELERDYIARVAPSATKDEPLTFAYAAWDAYALRLGGEELGGHWVTIDEHPVFIKDPVGEGRGFSRAELSRKIMDHHVAMHGDESDFKSSAFHEAGGGNETTFYKKLPGEVNRYLEGNPSARRLFKVTDVAAQAGGSDALSAVGDDKYFEHIGEISGNKMNAALETARSSPDPAMKFTAAIHDNMPPASERVAQTKVSANKLLAGTKFTIQGQTVRVVEHADGYKVLVGENFPETPVEALDKVPVDKGSIRSDKRSSGGKSIAPFSRESREPALQLGATPIQSFGTALVFALDGLKPYEKIQPPTGMPWDRNGQPIQYFRKEVLPAANLVDSTGRKHNVNAERIDKLVVNFNRAKSLGHLPSIPPRHEDAGDGAKNMGHVIDVEKIDGSLYAIEQRIGDDAIKAASRNGSSIGTLTNVVLQDGTVIDEMFDHNACIPNPQLGTKVECSLSASSSKVVPLCLQFSRTSSGDESMTDEIFGQVKLCFGRDIPADLSKDNAIEKLVALKTPATITDAQFADAKLCFGRDVPSDLSKDNALDKLAAFAKTLAAKIPQPKTSPTAEGLFLARKALESARRDFINDGDGTVAMSKYIETTFGGKELDEKVLAPLTLARKPSADDADLFDGIMRTIAAYEGLKGLSAGIKMSREVTAVSVDENATKMTDARKKELLTLAGMA